MITHNLMILSGASLAGVQGALQRIGSDIGAGVAITSAADNAVQLRYSVDSVAAATASGEHLVSEIGCEEANHLVISDDGENALCTHYHAGGEAEVTYIVPGTESHDLLLNRIFKNELSHTASPAFDADFTVQKGATPSLV